MSDHKHEGKASNTREAMSTFIGCRVAGVMAGVEHGSTTASQNVLLFECGWGLGWSDAAGTHWTLTPQECKRLIDRRRKDLDALQHELRDVLGAAGVSP